jgi:hypothetical protein
VPARPEVPLQKPHLEATAADLAGCDASTSSSEACEAREPPLAAINADNAHGTTTKQNGDGRHSDQNNSKMRQTTPLLALNTTPTSMQGFRPIRSDNAAPLGDNSNELNADTVATCALSIAAAVGEPATETASCMLAAWPTPTCSDEDRPS